ncbi:MAG: FxsA family protein, partial [Akkermansiaceae bacterium]
MIKVHESAVEIWARKVSFAEMFGRLLLLFILVPIAELSLFITLGDWIGTPKTIAIIIFTAIIGAAL